MKIIEENMDETGFGRVMEVRGHEYSQEQAFGPRDGCFRATGDKLPPGPWEKGEAAILRFQEFASGGYGRAQYVNHRYANWKSAKVVSENGPGNLADKK
jgi:hypothetical protein